MYKDLKENPDFVAAIEQITEAIKQENDGNHMDFLLPGYVTNRLIAYQGLRQDLILCKNALQKLLSDKNDPVMESCLFYTIASSYGKCFTDAASSKSPRLEEKDFGNGNDHLLETHKKLMDIRHNFVSHRGVTAYEVGVAFLKLGVQDLSRQVKVKQVKRSRPKTEDLPKFLELVNFLIGVCESKFYKAGVKAWDHMLNSFTAEELSSFKLAGPTLTDVPTESAPTPSQSQP